MDKTQFADKIIAWYEENKRDLPWRDTQNPYYIWLSEIILQQTRVKQGLPYYEKFIENYPTVQDLAQADEQSVLRLWQGLGYYSRARNLHHTAQFIDNQLDSKFPDNYKDLLKLKGVGKYTAAAIASFAFNEAVAVVDGNVFRVLARFFGIETDIASPKGAKEFGELAQAYLDKQNPATYNQAIMEFGAIQCTPQKPDCMYCPLQIECSAFQTGKQTELPVKNQKIKIRERYFHYIIFQYEDKLLLKKRNKKDIWEGLYDFFLIETKENFLNEEDLWNLAEFPKIDTNFVLEKESEVFTHILTHQKIYAKFWHIHLNKIPNFSENGDFYELKEIQILPKPILIANYLQKHFF